MDLIILLSALLPVLLLFLYIWKKDPQKEPTSLLVKAVLWGVGICIPVAFLELAINGIYDALAMSGIVNPYIGAAAFFILIYFCIKMHKVARTKVLALIEKDKNNEVKQTLVS